MAVLDSVHGSASQESGAPSIMRVKSTDKACDEPGGIDLKPSRSLQSADHSLGEVRGGGVASQVLGAVVPISDDLQEGLVDAVCVCVCARARVCVRAHVCV